MNLPHPTLRCALLMCSLCLLCLTVSVAKTPAQAPDAAKQAPGSKTYSKDAVSEGGALFRQECSFCHGRDAGGGESGPDLTRSRLVTADVGGDKIGPVIREGRPDKGMPPFQLSDSQIANLVAFIHTQHDEAPRRKGARKGVDASDLQTGNVEAGKQYFAAACASCHSPAGDLAGIASRYQGLELEQRMLYPKHAKSRVTVTLSSGQSFAGTLEYLDEFTVGLIDAGGWYRSWPTHDVQYKVDAPVNAHVELFPKYTDADVHNLMAYLQTLR